MRTSHAIGRVPATTITIASGGTTGNFKFQAEGFLRGIAYSLNNNTNNVTSVITIVDDQGVTIYTSAALNDNTSSYLTPSTTVCLYNAEHSCVVTSADPGASGNIASITLLIER